MEIKYRNKTGLSVGLLATSMDTKMTKPTLIVYASFNKSLGDSLNRQSDSEDEDGDGEVVIFQSHNHNQHDDDPPLDIRQSTNTPGWRKYTPAIKHIVPLRPGLGGKSAARIDQAGCLSFVTYAWVFNYLWSAFRGFIPRDQQWSCSIYDSTGVNSARLEYLWKEELKKPNPSLIRVVIRFFRTRLIFACIIFFICLVFGFIGPTCLVRALIAYAEKGNRSEWHYGVGLCLALLVVELLRVLSYGACWAISYRSGIRVRGAVLGLLFKKLVNIRSLKTKTTGEVINMYANDGQRLFDAVTFAPLVLMGPFVLIGGLIYLLFLLGAWSLLGVLVFVIFDIIQYGLGKTMVKFRERAIANTEKRVSVMTEVLQNIKMIKMNAWEEPFMSKVFDLRHNEKVCLRTAGYAQSLAVAAGPIVPLVAAVVAFLAYVAAGNDLLASQAFSAITVFFVMVFGIRMIPYGSRYGAEAVVALRNIQHILLLNEADCWRPQPVNTNVALSVQDASFAWDDASTTKTEITPLSTEPAPPVLKSITFSIEKKHLVGVCGPVGSGKTSLLNSIIGQMVQQDGNISLRGSLAYCAQQSWILNATVRENIVFGTAFDDNRYYKVLYACSLTQDLHTMPANDQTEIGERGVTLSGGQKARIALARALYLNKDVYLLDDILSSLDSSVSQHIFSYAIKGMLVGKTILLVTSNVQLLSACDEVLFMESGQIVDQGPHEEVLRRCPEYTRFCQNASQNMIQRKGGSIDNLLGDVDLIPPPVSHSKDQHEDSEERGRSPTMTGTESLFDIPVAGNGRVTDEEEDFGIGVVGSNVYLAYIRACGGPLLVAVALITLILNVLSTVFSSIWLSYWLKEGHIKINGSNGTTYSSLANSPHLSYFMTVYGLSLVLLVITSAVKAVFFVKMTLNAASNLHNNMFKRVMHATMKFFDATPVGRILNRFSKDMDEIDVKLPFTVETFLQNFLMVLAYIVIIAVVFPWFLIACIPLAIVLVSFVACFRAGIRSLKRLENISRSPLFEHISATLDGLPSIHAFEESKNWLETGKQLLDINTAALFLFHSAMRWLAVWLDLLVVFITFVTALLVVFMTGYVSPAYAGMALAFAIQMSGIFQFAVRLQSELEAKMTSVERVNFYTQNIEEEGQWYSMESRDHPPPLDWPMKGRISYRDVQMKYRDGLSLALKNISIDIAGQEKVGIVGRTGSGKTSLAMALFRMYPLSSGSISLDEIDTTTVGLHELRSKMQAIPQDPALFHGTVRFNLDPLAMHTDERLWQVLEKTQLKTLVTNLDGLDAKIDEGGNNMSSGERQLFCLARALLRNARVLLMDEATASLDSTTAHSINECLRDAFSQCTVLTIAHRLSSVSNSDKILFMEAGKVTEFDTPNVLLDDTKSKYYAMVKMHGQSTSVE